MINPRSIKVLKQDAFALDCTNSRLGIALEKRIYFKDCSTDILYGKFCLSPAESDIQFYLSQDPYVDLLQQALRLNLVSIVKQPTTKNDVKSDVIKS